MKMIVASLIAASALLGGSSALAAPCVGFADVDSASPFCPNVEWIRNRGITLGCAANAYCPADAVTRLAMAAFMNRLGTALTPVELGNSAASGTIDLDANVVVCQTADFTVSNFPRRAIVDLTIAATAVSDLDFAATPVMMIDSSGSWLPMFGGFSRTYVPANHWSSVSHVASGDLAVGTLVRFGILAHRDFLPGSTDLSDSRCQLRVLIFSRDGTSSPL